MKIIAIASHKGGVGKTTTSAQLAHHLSREHNQHVLLIDLDPQGNLSRWFGYGTEPGVPLPGYTIADVLRERERLTKVARPGPGLIQIVPADIRLEDTRSHLSSDPLGFQSLRSAIELLRPDDYNWVLIDCPPSADSLVFNALVACHYVVTPATPDEDAISGVKTICNLMTRIGKTRIAAPQWAGTIATKVNERTIKHQQYIDLLPQPLLGKIPLRQGLSADVDISEAYRDVTTALLAAIEEGDHAGNA